MVFSKRKPYSKSADPKGSADIKSNKGNQFIQEDMMKDLKVRGRFLTYEDGTPFFYLADTAWELLHRLTAEEAEHYFRERARQGFTAIIPSGAVPKNRAATSFIPGMMR